MLGGFSQGAVMSYALALGRRAARARRAVALSGFIPTVDGWEPVARRPRRACPVWIGHGSRDPVISVDFARRARDLLTPAGFTDVAYHESEAAHHLDPRSLPELAAWVGDALVP